MISVYVGLFKVRAQKGQPTMWKMVHGLLEQAGRHNRLDETFLPEARIDSSPDEIAPTLVRRLEREYLVGPPHGHVSTWAEWDGLTIIRYDFDDLVAEGIYSLDDCFNYKSNVQGDCGGRVERVDGIILCENCRNK